MRRRRNPEVVAGRVNADGSIAAGDGFTVVKGTAGNYTVTFVGGFRLMAVTTSTTSGSGYLVAPSAITASGFAAFNFNSSTLVAADVGFSFIAAGVQQ
jgi:hypothetical protein